MGNSKDERQHAERLKATHEQALNNTAAVKVLFDIVVRNGLITEEDFNLAIQKEVAKVKEELYNRVKEAGEKE